MNGRGLHSPSSALSVNMWPSPHSVATVFRAPGFHSGPSLPEHLVSCQYLGSEPVQELVKPCLLCFLVLQHHSTPPHSPCHIKVVGGTNLEGPGGEGTHSPGTSAKFGWSAAGKGNRPEREGWPQPVPPRPHALSHAEPRSGPASPIPGTATATATGPLGARAQVRLRGVGKAGPVSPAPCLSPTQKAPPLGPGTFRQAPPRR